MRQPAGPHVGQRARRTWPFAGVHDRRPREGPVDDVDFRGARNASATPEVLDAIERARAVIVGPSNPVISIGPILAVPGIAEALRATAAPVVAVSPIVKGEVLKPATIPFMQWAGHALSSDGIVSFYGDLLDGLVADERTEAVPMLEIDVLMGDETGRHRVAEAALRFAETLE